MKLLLALLLAALPALAQEAADGGVPSSDGGVAATGGVADAGASDLEQELQKAIQADQPKSQQQGGPQPAPSAAPVMPGRSAQSMNPDISAIVDADFGWQRRPMSFLNGDDPDLRPDPGLHGVGPAVQEVEIAASAIVDPYFKGEVYLTIPNLDGLEVEEAFATTMSLPWNLQAKMGSFRSAFGRQNGQHLHVQDFTRRPLVNAAFLGPDGLRGPGLQISWLAPLPFFLTLYGEVLRIRADEPTLIPDQGPFVPVATFGAEASRRPTLSAAAKGFFPFGDEWSLLAGASFASGRSPGVLVGLVCVPEIHCPPSTTTGVNRETELLGGDVYLKWKPPNVAGGYASLAFQGEAMFRHFAEGDGLPSEWDGGLYGQVVAQVARRWFLGARYDLVGVPTSRVLARTQRWSASVTFQASEFARVRGYLELERAGDVAGTLMPRIVAPDAPAAFLQLEISIGAHGAHPF